MKSLLVTRKMAPALARRVQASVEGRLGATALRSGLRRPENARLVVGLALLAALGLATVGSVAVSRHRAELAQSRDRLLEDYEGRRRRLAERSAVSIVALEVHLERLRGTTFEGASLPEAIRARLERNSLSYFRTSEDDFRWKRVHDGWAESERDPFLLCLLRPAPVTDEQGLREHLRKVAEGGAVRGVGLPGPWLVVDEFLRKDFRERVVRARSRRELEELRRTLLAAPFAQAEQVAGAETVVLVYDAEKSVGAVTEIDGGVRHVVRMMVVDALTNTVSFAGERLVDPEFVDEKRRSRDARRLSECRAATEIGGRRR